MTSSGLPIKKLVFANLEVGLKRIGFTKRKEAIYTLAITPEVLGWLGLNRSMRSGILEINPVVGVRHKLVEDVVAKCLELPLEPFTPATISAHLGYVGPNKDYLPWVFHSMPDCAERITQCLAEVEGSGIPYMQRLKTLDTLVVELATSPYSIPEASNIRRIVVLYLLGRHREATKYLRESLESQAGRSDEAARQFSRFARNVQNLFPK